LKILFVINDLGPGGAEKVLVNIANNFIKRGYSVSVILFSNEEVFYKVDKSIKLIYIHYSLITIPIIKYFNTVITIVNSLVKAFKHEDPDIIISFNTVTNIYSTIAARIARKKIIVSEHTNYDRNSSDIIGYTRRIVYPLSNAVVVLTNHDYEKYNFHKNVYVIPNPLILENKYQSISRKKIILGVGRLIDLKGFDLLIQAFSKVNANEWKMIILGVGPKKKELKELVTKFNLDDKIQFLGVTKEIEQYYKSASIFVLPSRTEGFPNALCEAMGYGCACVAFDCLTGPRDIINDGVDGILVKPENITDLTCAIQKLVDNPELRLSFGSKAKNIVKRLDINILSKKWVNIIDSINIGEK